MAKGEQYEARVEAWITPVLEQHQFELVDVEYVREVGVWYLRCYIDKEGGITVDDCEVISRLLGRFHRGQLYTGGEFSGTGTSSEERERFCKKHRQRCGDPPV